LSKIFYFSNFSKVMNISTRGSADSVIVALVLFTIYFYHQVGYYLNFNLSFCYCIILAIGYKYRPRLILTLDV
jgi:hypothetical protein